MEIRPIAFFKSPVEGKFGVPRQSGVAPDLRGEVRLVAPYDNPDALRGLEGFDFIWLIWEFSLNGPSANLTVRPPRLGGNERVGVFASRSPFRPNPLGLSCVRIDSIDADKGIIHVLGADLADGTPVYDIKPYVAYADCIPDAVSGFAAEAPGKKLDVFIPEELLEKALSFMSFPRVTSLISVRHIKSSFSSRFPICSDRDKLSTISGSSPKIGRNFI